MNTPTLTEDLLAFAEKFPYAEDLRKRHFLITGATGLLGSIMTKALLALDEKHHLGLEIFCPVRSMEKARNVFGQDIQRLEIQEIPLTQINIQTTGEHIDSIIHFAAPTASKYFILHPAETMNTIVDGTSALLEYARSLRGLKGFVYVSSLEVYGSILDDTNTVTEDVQGYVDPMDSRSCYPLAKRATECLCHCYAEEYGIPTVTARLTQTFGAGISLTDNRVFAQFARSAVQNADIILHTEGLPARPYCYTTDAISALLYILLRGTAGKAYNVANESTYISIRDMAEMIRRLFAPKIHVRIIPEEHCGYAPTTRLKLDCTRLRELGWTPQFDLPTMFGRLIRYLQETQSETK